jgi:predicted hydrocarbon binding protein
MIQKHDPKIANSQLRLSLIAMQQVIGEKSAQEIIDGVDVGIALADLPPDDLIQNLPAQDYAQLLAALEMTYSGRGARILSRIGRSMFHQVLREQPNWMSSARNTMGIWKPSRRISLVLEAIIDSQRKTYPNSESWIEHKNGRVAYIDQSCTNCFGRVDSSPICDLRTGFLSEAVRWATDKDFIFQETACIAAGDPYCRFSLDTTHPHGKASSNPK